VTAALAALSLGYILYLLLEGLWIRRQRARLAHVIHVNGTRGKTAVCRLIAAGLSAGGRRVLCKTTGTVPRAIHPDGRETPWPRRGSANIREQASVLRAAVRAGADILVVECMAVRPAYQRVCEQAILRADIAVITNARLDHAEEMGKSAASVAEALTEMMPANGLCVTAERAQLPVLARRAAARGTRLAAVEAVDIPPEIDHAENVAVALYICQSLGVGREAALRGMRAYRRDAYAQQVWALAGGGAFANLFSANDPASTLSALAALREAEGENGRPLVLIVNGRADRPERTEQMLQVIRAAKPKALWLTGSIPLLSLRRMRALGIPMQRVADARALWAQMRGPMLYCGIGNLKGAGQALVDIAREETRRNVP